MRLRYEFEGKAIRAYLADGSCYYTNPYGEGLYYIDGPRRFKLEIMDRESVSFGDLGESGARRKMHRIVKWRREQMRMAW